MRLVSQNRMFDLPYEQTMLNIERIYGIDDGKPIELFRILGTFGGGRYPLAEYSSKKIAEYLMDSLHMSYQDNISNVVAFPKEKDVKMPEADNDNA